MTTITAVKSERPSRWAQMWKSVSIVFESRVATVGLAIVLFWVLVGLISLFWTPYPPNAQEFVQNLPPNSTNWLGTDHLGRDIASRLMAGTQVILLKTRLPEFTLSGLMRFLAIGLGFVSLFTYVLVLARIFLTKGFFWGLLGIIPIVSFIWGWVYVKREQLWSLMLTWTLSMIAVVLLTVGAPPFQGIVMSDISIPIGVAIWGVLGSLFLGSILGLNAGYRGGWNDQGIMQVLDALIAFPQIVLYLVVIAALGQGDLVVILAITVTGAPGVARLARSLAMDIRTHDYIRAAETRGENVWFIMFREILPNARGPLLVDAMLRVGYAIFAIGTLGFLGIGLPPPDPDWGNMVNEARKSIFSNPLAVVWPSIAIASLVIGLNLFADGLREELTRYQK
jgi:ABC-type dipeptide/oligopeptide/nickel transport system permease subunit